MLHATSKSIIRQGSYIQIQRNQEHVQTISNSIQTSFKPNALVVKGISTKSRGPLNKNVV
eukprot:5678424-Amphidinium_carterae.2